ncbi:GntR family transcriptional regulator [Micromonospora tulbaghiae]|uniref:GntR family transcriptional regulator n=1 Tax=Actinomycetes TaxID=1760 RepID=UPI001B372141|nr:GntR family transcriptional regulator [Streptomyces sp. RM72]MBQ0890815.1 GntR family transcriptional regulator [Streptomyces sp. RM72]
MAGYAEIADHFRRRIKDGDLAPGDPLPPVRQISAEFGVAGTTTNRAFAVLKREGLIKTKPGAGTVVAHRPSVSATGLARLERLERTGNPYAPGETSTAHRVMRRSCADPEIADQLGIEPYDEVVVRSHVFLQEGKPTKFAIAAYNVTATSAVPELASDTQGVTKHWKQQHKERTGREINASPEILSARFASSDELAAFGFQEDSAHAAVPVLVVEVTYHDEEGPLAYWADVHAPGQKWENDAR